MNYERIGKTVMDTEAVFGIAPKSMLNLLEAPITAKEIAEKLEAPYNKVINALNFLMSLGFVTRELGEKPEGKRGRAPYLYKKAGD